MKLPDKFQYKRNDRTLSEKQAVADKLNSLVSWIHRLATKHIRVSAPLTMSSGPNGIVLGVKPTTSGSVVSFVKLDEPTWKYADANVIGDVYDSVSDESPASQDVEINAQVHGFFFDTEFYPAVKIGSVWQIISGGWWFVRCTLQENLASEGSASALVAVGSPAEWTAFITVYDRYGGAGEATGDVAIAGDTVGASWNPTTSLWEVTVNPCVDELVEAA